MADVIDIIQQLQDSFDASTDAFESRLEPPATPEQLAPAGIEARENDELMTLWARSCGGMLFRDTEYSQWGMVLVAPQDIVARSNRERSIKRVEDMRDDDLVVADFLGDLEAILYCPSEPPARRYLATTELDFRDEWEGLGGSFAEVLRRFIDSGGEKYWDRSGTGWGQQTSTSHGGRPGWRGRLGRMMSRRRR